MITKKFTINNGLGLHMRPAGVISAAMSKFDSSVMIVTEGKRINAKGIMVIMAACIKNGSEIELECDGQDEEAAMNKFEELCENGFVE